MIIESTPEELVDNKICQSYCDDRFYDILALATRSCQIKNQVKTRESHLSKLVDIEHENRRAAVPIF